MVERSVCEISWIGGPSSSSSSQPAAVAPADAVAACSGAAIDPDDVASLILSQVFGRRGAGTAALF